MPAAGRLGVLLRLIAPYFRSPDSRRTRALLAIVLLLLFAQVWVNIQINAWNASFFNALQRGDSHEFYRQLLRWFLLIVALIVVIVYQSFLRQVAQVKWREWLTARYTARWLADDVSFAMECARFVDGGEPQPDNPDQRIAEDVRDFTAQTLELAFGLIANVSSVAAFTPVLWRLSGAGRALGWDVPGYMLIVAVVYAAAGSAVAHLIGRPLVRLNLVRQIVEADFRFALVRVREAAEGIALMHGAPAERRALRGRFGKVAATWLGVLRRQKQVDAFSLGYSQFNTVFPYLVMAPRYFRHSLQIGDLVQTVSAYQQVQGALSWLIGSYGPLAAWWATAQRLGRFDAAVERSAERQRRARASEDRGGDALALEGVDVFLPDGRMLLRDLTLVVPRGGRTLLTGPSGCGKSTLFAVIAGVWPYSRGTLRLPQGPRMMFVPQKPYLPIGSLSDALAFPASASAFPRARIEAALTCCGLDALRPRLDSEEHWTEHLSVGEQQRLGFARVVLHEPDWLFLDEATSALGEADERELYALLRTVVPHATLVSVSHRRSAALLHDVCIDLSPWVPEPA